MSEPQTGAQEKLKECRIAWGVRAGTHINRAMLQAAEEGFTYLVLNDRIYQVIEPVGVVGTIREPFLRHPDLVGESEP